jgi:D-amino-acid dehydrogenase
MAKAVILGAGLMGVTTAWALAREGHGVTVIDRQSGPAQETSFANAGLIAPGHALSWANPHAPKLLLRSLFRDDGALRLRPRADPRLWAWCLGFLRNCGAERSTLNTARKLKLCVYSQQALQALIAETGIAYDAARKGLLYVYRDPAALARGIADTKVLRDGGQRMQVLGPADIVRIEPAFAPGAAKLAGGLYCPDDESGDAHLFTVALAEKCRAQGVTFRFGATIKGFDATADLIERVLTDRGAEAGEVFVLALGSHSPLLGRPLGLRLPLYPVKGYSLTVPARGTATPEVGGVDETNLVAWCRMGERLRLTATAEFSGYSTAHHPADFRAMLAAARELFPDGGEWERPSYWACLRPMTPSGLPIFGRFRHRNLWLNTGHGHLGWTMAYGSARITADLIAGRRPAIDLAGMTLEGGL